MPELPEVEVTKIAFESVLKNSVSFVGAKFRRKDLRYPLPLGPLDTVKGEKLLQIFRHGKYMVLRFESGYLISHLGMSGRWMRCEIDQFKPSNGVSEKHLHLILNFSSPTRDQNTGHVTMGYQDPRRFGFLVWCSTENELQNYLPKGADPISGNQNWRHYYQLAQTSKRPIKVLLLDQEFVAGVGNIYACEALFAANIHPEMTADQISEMSFELLWRALIKILNSAIKNGGSTLQDHQNLMTGKPGRYQQSHQVYGREGEPCPKCGTKVQRFVQAGRSTFFCPKCQPKKRPRL